jgi:hypothetical protein
VKTLVATDPAWNDAAGYCFLFVALMIIAVIVWAAVDGIRAYLGRDPLDQVADLTDRTRVTDPETGTEWLMPRPPRVPSQRRGGDQS